MRPSGWLARLGGAQSELLERLPGERQRFSTLGAVLLGTAGLAAISMTFALQTAVSAPLAIAVAVGLLWGVLILNLDRFLIVSMTRQSGWSRNLLAALPRLALAILLGAVISMPLVLRIFQPEIDLKLKETQLAQSKSTREGIDQQGGFTQIGPLQDQITTLSDPLSDPDLKRLTDELDARKRDRDQLATEVGCEVVADPACAGRVLGEGPRFREFRRKLDIAEGEIARLEPQVAALRRDVEARIVAQRGDPGTALGAATVRLAELQRDRVAREQQLIDTQQANTGLSARLQALSDLGRDNRMVRLSHLALFALFAAVEILPVFAKLLSLTAPVTDYERLAEQRVSSVLREETVDDGTDEQIDAIRRGVPVAIERDRAAAEVEAGKRMNARLVAVQEELAGQAVDLWRSVAATRTDTELRRWYRRQGAGAARNGGPAGSGGAAYAIDHDDDGPAEGYPPEGYTAGTDEEPPPGVRDYRDFGRPVADGGRRR